MCLHFTFQESRISLSLPTIFKHITVPLARNQNRTDFQTNAIPLVANERSISVNIPIVRIARRMLATERLGLSAVI